MFQQEWKCVLQQVYVKYFPNAFLVILQMSLFSLFACCKYEPNYYLTLPS